MKKKFKRLLLICTAGTIIFLACNKKAEIKQDDQQVNFKLGLTVSPRGFLIFKKFSDFEGYTNFIKGNTPEDVKSFLASIHFKGKATKENSFARSTSSSNSELNYILDENDVVQIENVVMKLTDDQKFMLTMIGGNLTEASYADLINGVYNSSFMDKFSTFPDEGSPLLIPFVNETPIGYEETGINEPGTNAWFGWENGIVSTSTNFYYNGIGQCVGRTTICKPRTYYFFGIAISHQDRCEDQKPQVQLTSTNCDGPSPHVP